MESIDVAVSRASGCGKTGMYAYGSDDQWVSPTERASFELGCPVKELTETSLSAKSVGITGCGKKVVYVAAGDPRGRAEWLLNSSTKSD